MKKILLIFCFGNLLLASSCKEVWDEDDKKLFQKACMDDARTWAGSEAKATTYCDCVLEKIIAKYPHENDALDHMDSIIHDKSVLSCRQLIAK